MDTKEVYRKISHPKQKGELTEQIILSEIMSYGLAVSVPIGDNQEYDLIVENNQGTLVKVQCKTGKFSNGTVTASLERSRINCSGCYKKSYTNVDFYCILNPDNGKVYVIKPTGKKSIVLRLDFKVNNKNQNCANRFEMTENSFG